ncbi:MAG: DUF6817 domain-containing protein [Chromatocurvus sp.]
MTVRWDIAQSNIQLYGQLQRRGYGDDEISEVARAYRLAQEMFSAQFRGSGRPFLCHLVGTASILARDAAPVHLVIAGLLHAVYSAGIFSFDMHRRVSTGKRARVSKAVGDKVDELLVAYDALPWSQSALAKFAEHTPVAQQQVLKIRLANELDDLLDSGLYYSGEAKRSLVESSESRRLLAVLVSRTEMPALEKELKAALLEFSDPAQVLPGAPETVGRDYSYTLLPPSARERVTYRIAVLRGKINRRLRRNAVQ